MKYDIKVIGYREALEIAYNYTDMDSFEAYAIISIQEVEGNLMGMQFKAGGKCKLALNIHFSDIDPKDFEEEEFKKYTGELKPITEEDVKKIWAFVNDIEIRDDIEVLYVQCHAGVSRSPAVAAAIKMWHEEDDRDYFRSKIYYPNMYVYEQLLKYKLDANDVSSIVEERKYILRKFMEEERLKENSNG